MKNCGIDSPMRLNVVRTRSVTPPGLAAGQHTERDAGNDGDEHPEAHELQRAREVVEHDGQRRVPSNIGALTEVEADQAAEEVHELNWDALVEPELRTSSGTLSGRGRERQHELHGIADEPSDDEDEHGHSEDDHEALYQSTGDVASHDVVLPLPAVRSPAQPVTDISLTRSFESTRGVQVRRVERPYKSWLFTNQTKYAPS